ncbi:MAG: hypothetical protein HXX13_13380 [Bacteroidetes bacterium]|nr:hypothetical protein [Bacteroidota bacterium]
MYYRIKIYSNLPKELSRRVFFFILPMILILPVKLPAQGESSHTVFGVVAGAGYGKLKSNDLSDSTFKFKTSYTMIGGFSMEIPIPKLEQKATFYNELTFSQFKANSSVSFPGNSPGANDLNYVVVTQKFVPDILTLCNMFRYCFTNGEFKYFVSAGIYNSFVIHAINLKTRTRYENGIPAITEEDAVPEHSIHGLMLELGTGIYYKYAGLEFRYDPGRNYTKVIDYSIYNPTLSVMLLIRLNP